MNPPPTWLQSWAPLVAPAIGWVVTAIVAGLGWWVGYRVALRNQAAGLRRQLLNEARTATVRDLRTYQDWLKGVSGSFLYLMPEGAAYEAARVAGVMETIDDSLKEFGQGNRWLNTLREYRGVILVEDSDVLDRNHGEFTREVLWLAGRWRELTPDQLQKRAHFR